MDKVSVQPKHRVDAPAELDAVFLALALETCLGGCGCTQLGRIFDCDICRPVIAAVLKPSFFDRDAERAVLISVLGKVLFDRPLFKDFKIDRQQIIPVGKIRNAQFFCSVYRRRLRAQHTYDHHDRSQSKEELLHVRFAPFFRFISGTPSRVPDV